MIGQHLILRCKKGVYEKLASPGYKTAAISSTISEMSEAAQFELDNAIKQCAIMPDAVKNECDPDKNRGIIHLFPYKDLTFVIRIRRVNDLCTFSGSVSFAHSFVLRGDDRTTFLENPFSLINTNNFDSYASINERCGGLENESIINVDDNLSIIKDSSYRISAPFLEEVGFNRESFSKCIASICKSVCDNSHVVIIPRNVSSNDWKTTGGSRNGDVLLAYIIQLLPNCITRFLSATSYWNESPDYPGLKNIKLQILSGRHKENIEKSYISLFDFQDNNFNNNCTCGSFGDYLWEIRHNPTLIKEFHNKIEDCFGDHVDSILKLPEVMNLITDLINHNQTDNIKNEKILCSLLEQIGHSIALFPKINEKATELTRILRDTKSDFSSRLENLFIEIIKEEESRHLLFYDNILNCLLNKIILGNGMEASIKIVSNNIRNKRNTTFREDFIFLLNNINSVSSIDISNSLLKLILSLDTKEEVLSPFTNNIQLIINKVYQNYLIKGKTDKCIAILKHKLAFCKGNDDIIRLSSYYSQIIPIIQDSAQLTDLVLDASTLLEKSINSTELSVLFSKRLFPPDNYTSILNRQEVFPLFVRCLYYCVDDAEYCSNIWQLQYEWILSTFNVNYYMNAQDYIKENESYDKNKCILYIEKAKIRSLPNYSLSIDTLNLLIPNDAVAISEKYVFFRNLLLFNIQNGNDYSVLFSEKFNKLLVEYYLYCYTLSDCSREEINSLESVITESVLENEKNAILKQIVDVGLAWPDCRSIISDAFISVWQRLYSVNDDWQNNDLFICAITNANLVLKGTIFENIILEQMSPFVQKYVKESDRNIAKISDEIVAFLFYGGLNYNWQKKWTANQVEDIMTCYYIDDTSDTHINYFLDKLKDKTDNNLSDSTINRCESRLLKFISNSEYIIRNENDIQIEKVTLLSLMYLLCFRKVEYHKADEYLNKVRGSIPHYRDGEFLMYALRYISMIRTPKNSYRNLVSSLTDVLTNRIKDANENFVTRLLVCERFYCKDIQKNGFEEIHQNKLKHIAASKENPALENMFTVRVFKPRLDSSNGIQYYEGQSNNKSWIIVSGIIISLVIITVVLILYNIKPIIGMISAIVILVIAELFSIIIIPIIVRKRRKK